MYLLLLTQSEDPRAYFTNLPLGELVEALNKQSWRAYIYELKTAETQTPNPFGGAYLKEPIKVVPSEHRNTLLQNYLIEWDGMSKEQVIAETKRAVQAIYDRQNKFLDSIKQEEQHPQTEVIEVKP